MRRLGQGLKINPDGKRIWTWLILCDNGKQWKRRNGVETWAECYDQTLLSQFTRTRFRAIEILLVARIRKF